MCQQLKGLSGPFRSASPTLEQETVEEISKEVGRTKYVCMPGIVLGAQIFLNKRLLLRTLEFQRGLLMGRGCYFYFIT